MTVVKNWNAWGHLVPQLVQSSHAKWIIFESAVASCTRWYTCKSCQPLLFNVLHLRCYSVLQIVGCVVRTCPDNEGNRACVLNWWTAFGGYYWVMETVFEGWTSAICLCVQRYHYKSTACQRWIVEPAGKYNLNYYILLKTFWFLLSTVEHFGVYPRPFNIKELKALK